VGCAAAAVVGAPLADDAAGAAAVAPTCGTAVGFGVPTIFGAVVPCAAAVAVGAAVLPPQAASAAAAPMALIPASICRRVNRARLS
jgi:hypothetical protein